MTILSVQESKRSGSQDEEAVFQYSRTYIIKSDAKLSEKEALEATGIPVYDENLPDDTDAGVVGKSATPKDGEENYIWDVVVKYKTRPGKGDWGGGGGGGGGSETPEDPTTQRPVVIFGSTQYTQVVEKAYQTGDAEGSPSQAILNSAEDAFDPPVQLELSRTVVEVQYNTRRFETNWMREYENTINSESILIGGLTIPAYQGRMIYINAQPLYDTLDELYWAVDVKVEINPEGYVLQLLDQGFNYLKSGVKTEITVEDKDGEDVPTSEPLRLDGTGGVLALESASVYEPFEIYFSKPWKALNLPREY